MKTTSNIVTTPTSDAVSNGLQRALEAAQKLAECNCKIIGAFVSNKGATLHIVAPPAFVTGGLKRRYRGPDGLMMHVMATRYFGVQLEWQALVPDHQVVGHA